MAEDPTLFNQVMSLITAYDNGLVTMDSLRTSLSQYIELHSHKLWSQGWNDGYEDALNSEDKEEIEFEAEFDLDSLRDEEEDQP